MRLHRFFIDRQIENTKETISDLDLIHQWRSVFRYNIGSEVILFDGGGKEYSAVLEKLSNREAEVRLVSERKGLLPERQITLFQSLIKKDNMEWVVEKATELGVSSIVPIVSERSEKKGFNAQRARKIAIEASEQCGRADVPEISEIRNLGEVLESCKNIIVFDSSGVYFNNESRIRNYGKEDPLHNSHFISNDSCLFIGPEGGWTEKELELFKQKGASIFSLGPLTLRAETAAIVALATLIPPGLEGQ